MTIHPFVRIHTGYVYEQRNGERENLQQIPAVDLEELFEMKIPVFSLHNRIAVFGKLL